jgi:hypothetical protein
LIREDIIPEKRQPEATPDPGRYDAHLTPFASDLKTTANMGSKYKFVPKEGPPPGMYENSTDVIKPRIKDAIIREDVAPYRRPAEKTPDPGTYDGHLTGFGDGLKNVDFGEPYKFKPKEGPAPGQYNGLDSQTKPKVKHALIKEDTSPFRRPAEKTPDPGTYDGHLTGFGDGLKNVDFGEPYKFVPKEGPAPGQYDGLDS